MKAGDVVRVHEDPITCKKLEGSAYLIRQITVGYYVEPGLEIWDVKFVGGHRCDPRVRRLINIAAQS